MNTLFGQVVTLIAAMLAMLALCCCGVGGAMLADGVGVVQVCRWWVLPSSTVATPPWQATIAG